MRKSMAACGSSQRKGLWHRLPCSWSFGSFITLPPTVTDGAQSPPAPCLVQRTLLVTAQKHHCWGHASHAEPGRPMFPGPRISVLGQVRSWTKLSPVGRVVTGSASGVQCLHHTCNEWQSAGEAEPRDGRSLAPREVHSTARSPGMLILATKDKLLCSLSHWVWGFPVIAA